MPLVNDTDGMKTAVAALRMKAPNGPAGFLDGVEHGVELALRRIRNGDSPDAVQADVQAIVKLVHEALDFVGPSGR